MASPTVRDFSRAGQSALSPTSPTSPVLQRQESVRSRMSTNSSGHLRHRKISRADTVTAFRTNDSHGNWQPGAEPGIDPKAQDEDLPSRLTDLKTDCDIRIIDYSESDVVESMADNDNIEEFLKEVRRDDLPCRWISVNGLSWDVIKILGDKYNLHRLAIEDLIHRTRTKVDWYTDNAFIVLTLQKLVRLHQNCNRDANCHCRDTSSVHDDIDEKGGVENRHHKPWWRRSKVKGGDVLPRYLDQDGDGKVDEFVRAHSGVSEDAPIRQIRTLHRYESSQVPLHTAWMERHSALAKEDLAVSVEQVSLFLLADNTVISFFEQSAEDVEDPIMKRLNSKATILRRSADASLLTQAIIDTIVDLAVPVRDAYNKCRKELQIDALTTPNIKTSRALHIFGEEVDMLQNLFKPIVHLVNALRDHNSEPSVGSQVPSLVIPSSNAPPVPPPQPSAESDNSEINLPHPPTTHLKSHHRIKRDMEGFPVFKRNLSEFQRLNINRSNTITSVVITPIAHTYFGDVFDHCITMISSFEQMDASASNISDLIFNTVGAKTNNFMMILAVVTVFFAPLTFISGYFGMNFAGGTGLQHPFAFFWTVALPSLAGFMLIVFATMLWDQIRDLWEQWGVHGTVMRQRRR